MKKKLVLAGLAICMAMAAPAVTKAPAANNSCSAGKCDKACMQTCGHCDKQCTPASCAGTCTCCK